MLTHPTHGRLVTLGLTGMAKALDEQQRQPDIATLAFEERLALLVDREATERENKRLVSRLRFASLRQNAVVEDIDMKAPRGLDKALFQKLVAGEWIERYQNLLIIGPTGVGKSWIACALGKRQRTRVFTELQSHYLFEDRFGRPGKGNDKGKVEGLVGYARRKLGLPDHAQGDPRQHKEDRPKKPTGTSGSQTFLLSW